MSKLSNKTLFAANVPNFGANIPQSAIQVHIDQFVEFNAKEILGVTLINALETLANTSNPPTNTQMYALLTYVYNWVTFGAAAKWIIFHGQNATQFGFSHINGNDFTTLDNKARSTMSAQLDVYAGNVLNDVIGYLNSLKWVVDGVAYPNPNSTNAIDQSPRLGITSIRPKEQYRRRGY